MTNHKRQAIHTRRVRKKGIIHQSLHRILQILPSHALELLPILHFDHAVHSWRGGKLAAIEGRHETFVAVVPDLPPDVLAAVVESDDEIVAVDILA